MRELTKSAVSSTLALSLFGARQAAAATLGRGGSSCTDSVDAVTNAATSHLADRLGQIYRLGDGMQRGVVDVASAALRLQPAGMLLPSLDVAEPIVQGIGLVSPRRDWLIDWQELRNKVDIYDLVQNVEDRISAHPDTPIAELVERAYALGDFHALWAVEGLGHFFAEQALTQSDTPSGLLTDPGGLSVPDKSLLMLNAGIGAAFAEKVLTGLVPCVAISEFSHAVTRFKELCRINVTPGYTAPAFESLGLVAWMRQPPLFRPLATYIADHHHDLLGYFWHGAGRSFYFSRKNLCSPISRIFWGNVDSDIPHDLGRRNFAAGLAWAVTLVNMLQPQIIARLVQVQGNVLSQDDVFANGVASSVIMRYDTTPQAKLLKQFCEYQMQPSSGAATLWNRLVRMPTIRAIHKYYPTLKRRNSLGEVFQYRSRSYRERQWE